MTRVFAEHRPTARREPGRRDARRPLHRQPPPFIDTNIVGTFVLLETARQFVAEPARRRDGGVPLPARVDRRGVRLARARSGAFSEETPVRAELALRGQQGVGRPPGARLLPHLRPAGADHELLEQLRAVSVSGEADSADDSQRARRASAADLRRRRQRPRLAARRGSLRGHAAGAARRGAPGEKYNIGGGNERTNLQIVDRDLRRARRSATAASNPALRGGDRLSRAEDVRARPARPRSPLRDRRHARFAASWAGRRGTTSRPASRETVQWYLEHRDWCERVQAGRYDRRAAGTGHG